ncbi:type I polyketide synthase [Candidatus Chloroploca sp. Khr17]|uniref:type I polyketide synthase n=1 Tax=Candidatus Chloroploca sp. Khr17 TaxID=2496869 RepID=UPI00101C1797|nr:type I polyketide synthase [Candidatus Chloroploca sp. Khr17]
MSEQAMRSKGQATGDREPIAIVGIGCRLPGGADSPAKLWQLLEDRVNAVGLIPPDRFDRERLYDERPAMPGKIMTRWGGFLDDIDLFDAEFFGISPREAERLDPQQRLLLEVAWEALADAGIAPASLRGGQAGVFVGMWLNEFESRLFADPSRLDLYMTTGSGRYTASGRIAYMLDIMGPSITVDTACSSSLVAIHLACQSLWSGETPLALAGGANVILQPHITIAYSQSRMLASDGRCKFGDALADGYVRSDGAAMVALRRLSDALAAGDPIYAVIRGSAVTNDGRSSGFLATPGQFGQEEMLRRAYANAGLDPQAVHYVEAHGTGTRAGDPVELGALGAIVGAGRPADRPCLVGSIKTNLGHTEGAAGVAGMIKVALALKHRHIPASLHLQEPNPNICWDGLAICAEAQLWPDDGRPATGGVSSFGIAGTNAHVVLQEAPVQSVGTALDRRAQLLVFSAHTPAALVERARAVQGVVSSDGLSLAALSYTTGARQAHLGHRLAVATHDRTEAVAALAAFAAGGTHPALRQGEAAGEPLQVAFVFPGQGSQWLGMARQLLDEEPVFAAALAHCDEVIHHEAGWSLLTELTADERTSRLDQIDVVQPTLFAIQVALAALWRAWGIEPTAVVGHSMGEVAAAHVAGALSLADAAAIICRRSRLLRRVRGQGAMAVVSLPLAEAHQAIAGLEDRLAVAVSNSPRSTVLSGDPTALERVLAQLQARNIFCRLVKVDVASHSPQVDGLLDELVVALATIEPLPAHTPLCSTVTGDMLVGEAARAALGPAYWMHNLRQPVRFADAVVQLHDHGVSAYIEMSPHPILLGPVEETLEYHQRRGLTLPSLQRGLADRVCMLGALGTLYTHGIAPHWHALHPAGGTHVALPPYPWQRRRYWMLPTTSDPAMTSVSDGTLLGRQLPSLAIMPDTRIWIGSIQASAVPPVLRERIAGVEFLSWAYYVGQALQAAAGSGSVHLGQVVCEQELILAGDETRMSQVVLARADGERNVRIFSRPGEDETWVAHVQARVDASVDMVTQAFALDAICPDVPVTSASPVGLIDVRRSSNEALARLAPVDEERQELADALALGAGMGLLRELVAERVADEQVVTEIGNVAWHEGLIPVWVYARCNEASVDGHGGEVYLLDEQGQVAMGVTGVHFAAPSDALKERAAQARAADWLYELTWRPLAPTSHPRSAHLLIFANGTGPGEELARLVQEQGSHAVLVYPGDAFAQLDAGSYRVDPADSEGMRRLFTEALPPQSERWDAVVYTWGIGYSATSGLTVEQLLSRLQELAGGALSVAQALAAEQAGARLWLITQGAVDAGSNTVAPEQATLWGLGRVLANEHPEQWGGLIDLDDSRADVAQRLLDALLAGDGEDQVALRGSVRQGARLSRTRFGPPGPALRPDVTYLITGGLGGVGRVLARWMLDNGARNVALLGRSVPGEAYEALLRAYGERDAQIIYLQADVAQAASLAEALAVIAASMPPLGGIIHTAGVLDDAALLGQRWGHFERVMDAKVLGAWNLHQQTAGLDLDMFVVCSSANALIGMPGQANYAAANAFLDALAQMRRAAGLAALSISWGRWDEVGLATREGRDAHLERRGLAAMEPASAAAAFGLLRSDPRAHIAVAAIDWTTLLGSLPRGDGNALLRQLADEGALRPQAATVQHDLLAVLTATPASERYERCLEAVRGLVATVLRFEHADQVAPDRGFFQMGMDSLTALELRSLLGQKFGRTFSATLAIDYPTAAGLARHLLVELFPVVLSETPEEAAHDELDGVARDDLKALLDAELDAIDL